MLRRVLLLAACALAAARLRAEDPPAPPEGFRWKQVESVKAAFLMPEGWFFQEERKGDIRAFFISKENIAKGGEFATGLTVSVVKLKEGALERAKTVIAQSAQLGEVQKLWEEENGALQLYGARIHVTKDPPAFTEHLLAIGNTRTNALYIVLFESPDASWDEAWKKGEVMLGNFLLDDEF